MIFGADLRHKIVTGRKTMTRRPVKEPQLVRRTIKINGERRPAGPERWTRPFEPKVGGRIAVQPGRGQHAVAHILVADVRRELVGEITYEDARREGFRTTEEFKVYWVRLYDRAWIDRQERVVHPDGVVETLELLTDEDLVARFDERHANRLVWVIGFELARDEHPLFLTPAAREPSGGAEDSDDAHGYTENPSRALLDAGEVLDRRTADRFTTQARARDDARAAEQRARQLQARARTLRRHLRAPQLPAGRTDAQLTAELVSVEEQLRQIHGRAA